MKALKTLVIAMGVLIVVGIGLIGYGLTRGKPQSQLQPPPAESAASAMTGGYFTSDVPVPRGGKLEQVTATGDRLVLRFSGAEGGDRLLLLDAHSGKLAGSITLTPDSH